MALSSARLGNNSRLQAAANNQPPLAKGESDTRAVEILQSCLVELGFDLPRSTKPSGLSDGIFGAETEQAVRLFQRKNGLVADGIAGRETLGRLDLIFASLFAAEQARLGIQIAAPNGGWLLT
jgi:peptidoglycan hydrolase-like protein with peptidoglycan-binding domain